MCLLNVKKTYRKPSNVVVRAYKILKPSEDVGGLWCTPYQNTPVPVGEWMEAKRNPDPLYRKLYTEIDGERYNAGFHVYKTRKGAEIALKLIHDDCASDPDWWPDRRCWRVVEVLVSEVMHEGKDGSSDNRAIQRLDNLVARKMLVPKFVEPEVGEVAEG